MMEQIEFHIPTIQEIESARKAFEEHELRDLFYRAATELVDLAISGKTSLKLAEALAVLLITWNRSYYQYQPVNNQHFADIEYVINSHQQILKDLRERSIESLSDEDEAIVKQIFESFEKVLGPVGAAKALHLLAPHFFPLWDRAIAKAYKIPLKNRGKNAQQYCNFITITREQYLNLITEWTNGGNLLKAIDEYNYCKYTKKWIEKVA